MNLRTFLPALLAGAMLAVPSASLADSKYRKITVHRDLDGDGHYNKKTYKVPRGHYGSHYGGRHYHRPYSRGYYGSPYYGSYYGSPYYSRPSIGFSYTRYSQPAYSSSYSTRVYRGAPASSSYSSDLAVDVQRELRRRGYYRGPIDGDIGSGSRSAIRRYQSDRGLAVTGRIDSRLVRSLGIG